MKPIHKGTVLKILWPASTPHPAIVLDATVQDTYICACGSSGARPERRYRIDWDQPPAASWRTGRWPKGTTNFYAKWYGPIPASAVLEVIGEVPKYIVDNLIDFFAVERGY